MRRTALLLAVILAVLLAACRGDGDGAVTVDGERIPESRLTGAVEGLCEARAEAPGDLTAARAAFYDRSHEMLHAIAAALEPVDRPQAARLLEAKESVEADLAAAPPPPELGADLDRLTEVTRTGLERLEVESPPCPG